MVCVIMQLLNHLRTGTTYLRRIITFQHWDTFKKKKIIIPILESGQQQIGSMSLGEQSKIRVGENS